MPTPKTPAPPPAPPPTPSLAEAERELRALEREQAGIAHQVEQAVAVADFDRFTTLGRRREELPFRIRLQRIVVARAKVADLERRAAEAAERACDPEVPPRLRELDERRQAAKRALDEAELAYHLAAADGRRLVQIAGELEIELDRAKRELGYLLDQAKAPAAGSLISGRHLEARG